MKPGKCDRVAGRPRDPAADEAILRTVAELFVEHGAEGVTFEQISKRSGLARATIYRRWKNKNELLVAALRHYRTQNEQDLHVLLQISPHEAIDYLTKIFIETVTRPENPKLLSRLAGSVHTDPELMALYRESIHPMWDAISKPLETARKSGLLPRLPEPDLLLELLGGAVLQHLLMRRETPDPKKEKVWVQKLFHQLGLEMTPEKPAA
jgi:AcrR family transcriptional regulator